MNPSKIWIKLYFRPKGFCLGSTGADGRLLYPQALDAGDRVSSKFFIVSC
jgi:hypothetical protein